MKIKKKELFDYIMLLMLVFVSGNLAFSEKSVLLVVFILSAFVFIYRKKKYDKTFIYLLLSLVIILLLQSLKFNFFPTETYIGVFIRVLIAYHILNSIEVSFIKKFINLMYYLALISLIFYFSILIFPNIDKFLMENFAVYIIDEPTKVTRYNILGLYTIIPGELYKNAGPFWEMGAFGGYLIITLMFSLINNFTLKSKKNIILLIAIITTQSTTAYIALFLLLSIFYYKTIKNKFIKYLIIGTFFFSGFYAYTSLDFLGKKIEHQLAGAKNIRINGKADSQRFINIIKDWHDFQGHEIIGRGPNSLTRYSFKPEHQIRTVGSTDMIVRYGLPFFILLLYLMYNSLYIYGKYMGDKNKFQAIGMLFIILILLMSEVYFLFPLFWILVLLSKVYKKNSY